MILDPQLAAYASNNDPLPKTLQKPLNKFLAELDIRLAAYDRDRKSTGESIDARRSMIRALEREIKSLESMEKRLMMGQVALQSQKTRYSTIMTPIRRVPPEVVASIIHFAISTRRGYVGHGGRVTFLQIRSVCRLWRATSFSTPPLWRAIERNTTYSTSRQASMWHRLASWFARAGVGAPLQLDIFVYAPSHGVHLLNFISKSGLNVTALDFSSTLSSGHWDISSLEILRTSYSKPLPIKYLMIELRNTPIGQPQSDGTISLAKNFPNLIHLQLSQDQPTSPPSPISVMLSHPSLTLLHLHKVSLTSQRLKSLLVGLPRLSSLYLHDCAAQVPDFPSHPYMHPSITVLNFRRTLPEHLFAHSSFPSLKLIALEDWLPLLASPESDEGHALGSFLERCGDYITAELIGTTPCQLLLNVLQNSTTVTFLRLPGPSLLYMDASASCGHRHVIPIPWCLTKIVFDNRVSPTIAQQVSEFARRARSRLAEGQAVKIYTPNRSQSRPLCTITRSDLLYMSPVLVSILAKMGACPHELSGSYGH
ncbi:hypothetical protein BKA70DRAFT_1413285 [Coprinopsis sp. MPI-PUGE-AT-0042]|nr:hypothetical protein BKA70DRAFT_1413285 [Coprinopsis sp. MPI-PUGE-AT-0042]